MPSAVAIIFSIFSTCQSVGCGHFRSAGNAALDAGFDDTEEAGFDGLNTRPEVKTSRVTPA